MALTLGLTDTVAAQDRQAKELVIYHRARPADTKGQWAPRLDFLGPNEFSLRSGERVYFTIVQTPLLFDYSATPITATLTVDAEVVKKFVDSLAALAEPDTGGAARDKTQRRDRQVGPFECAEKTGVSLTIDKVTREICALDSFVLTDRGAFGDLVTHFQAVPGLIVEAANGKDIQAAEAVASSAPKRIRAVVKAAQKVRTACSALGLQAVSARLADGFGMEKKFTVSCAPGSQHAGTILEVVDNVLAAAVESENMAKALEMFGVDVRAVGLQPLTDEKDDKKVPRFVAYDAEYDQKMTVKIKRTKRYDKNLSADQIGEIEKAVTDQVGEYEFVFHPRNLARYRFGGGVVYSLVTRSTFETVKVGDDLFVHEKLTGSSNFGASFMLNIVSVGLSDPSFEPYLQVGVGPKRDSVAFYAGIGMYGFNKFAIGLGAAIEKTDALTNGIHPGDKIADPARLKDATYQRYKAGLYFQISVKP